MSGLREEVIPSRGKSGVDESVGDGRKMSLPNITKTVEFIIENAPEFGKAKAQRVYLEEFRKSKKAMLMRQALMNGIEAANAQEREAYANQEYRDLLEGLAAAIETEETLRWKLEAARITVEVWRSQEATNRMQSKATE